jgi:hypothetical protein
MKASRIPTGLILAAALVLSASTAFAAAGDLRALSESEMSDVYGRGLSDPALSALGALTLSEQSGSGMSAQAAAEALAAFSGASGDGLQNLDRQLTQQRLQAGTTSVQASLKIESTMAALSGALAPIGSMGLAMFPIPLLFALPALPSLDAIQKKH